MQNGLLQAIRLNRRSRAGISGAASSLKGGRLRALSAGCLGLIGVRLPQNDAAAACRNQFELKGQTLRVFVIPGRPDARPEGLLAAFGDVIRDQSRRLRFAGFRLGGAAVFYVSSFLVLLFGLGFSSIRPPSDRAAKPANAPKGNGQHGTLRSRGTERAARCIAGARGQVSACKSGKTRRRGDA